jgi:hypothetical protein
MTNVSVVGTAPGHPTSILWQALLWYSCSLISEILRMKQNNKFQMSERIWNLKRLQSKDLKSLLTTNSYRRWCIEDNRTHWPGWRVTPPAPRRRGARQLPGPVTPKYKRDPDSNFFRIYLIIYASVDWRVPELRQNVPRMIFRAQRVQWLLMSLRVSLMMLARVCWTIYMAFIHHRRNASFDAVTRKNSRHHYWISRFIADPTRLDSFV